MRMRAFISAAVLALLSVPAVAQPVRTFVATHGLDTNACSLTAPCRNFAAAVAVVAPGGEVVPLDTGGYGPVSINKAVSLIAPPGIHAAIAPTGTPTMMSAVEVTGPVIVVLRGMFFRGNGALFGIRADAGSTVHVERMTVNFFNQYGVMAVNGSTAIVDDSTLSENNVNAAAYGLNTPGVRNTLAVSRTRLQGGAWGLLVLGNGRASCTDCIASNQSNYGYQATAWYGVLAELLLERCAVTHVSNIAGISAESHDVNGGGTALVRVSDSRVSQNHIGLEAMATEGCSGCHAQLLSRLNNVVESNTTDGFFTGMFATK